MNAPLSRLSSSFRLIAAPFTPFDREGKVQPGRIEPLAEWLREHGVSGVFVNGTTGEGLSLTQAERKLLAEHWAVAAGKNSLHLTVHVGHAAAEEARDLALHAESIGVDAIASLGPIFFTADTPASLVGYCRRIAEGAPKTPFYYYHLPSMSRVGVKASEVLPLLAAEIPTFAGVKFTHEDLADYRRCLELGGEKFPILFGRDELFLDGAEAGARAAVGSTYNFAAPLYLAAARARSEGRADEAARLQKLCTDAIGVMVSRGGLVGIKATMALAGFDCGPTRSPLRTLDAAEMEALRKELEQLSFFEAIQRHRS